MTRWQDDKYKIQEKNTSWKGKLWPYDVSISNNNINNKKKKNKTDVKYEIQQKYI